MTDVFLAARVEARPSAWFKRSQAPAGLAPFRWCTLSPRNPTLPPVRKTPPQVTGSSSPRITAPKVVCLLVNLAFFLLDFFVNYRGWIDISSIRRLFNTTREDGMASWFAVIEHADEEATLFMEQVVRRENMLAAYKRVVLNGGAPGVDGVSVDDLWEHCQKHWRWFGRDCSAERTARSRSGRSRYRSRAAGACGRWAFQWSWTG